MIENGFYKISQDFIDLIRCLGGKYQDAKERPMFCCFEDKYINKLYWAIPTSDLSHRDKKVMDRINYLINLHERDIRSCWYHIGHTNRPALYRISNCFPITERYIDDIYTSKGKHLMLMNKKEIEIIRRKLSRVLFDESKNPNKYEQRISDIKEYLIKDLLKEISQDTLEQIAVSKDNSKND